MAIKEIVSKLIKKHGTNDPFAIAKNMGIIILYEPLGTLRGYYNNFQRNRFIHINSNLPISEQKVVCGHELGHVILHKKMNICFLESNTLYVKNKFEVEANRFAVELLISDEMILKSDFEELTIEQIASAFEIDINLLRLKNYSI